MYIYIYIYIYENVQNENTPGLQRIFYLLSYSPKLNVLIVFYLKPKSDIFPVFHTHTHTHIYIYIYIKRERDRYRDRDREREFLQECASALCIYIHRVSR